MGEWELIKLKAKFWCALAVLVAASVAWRVAPEARAYIDAGMFAAVLLVMFRLGVMLDAWLAGMEARSARRRAPGRRA